MTSNRGSLALEAVPGGATRRTGASVTFRCTQSPQSPPTTSLLSLSYGTPTLSDIRCVYSSLRAAVPRSRSVLPPRVREDTFETLPQRQASRHAQTRVLSKLNSKCVTDKTSAIRACTADLSVTSRRRGTTSLWRNRKIRFNDCFDKNIDYNSRQSVSKTYEPPALLPFRSSNDSTRRQQRMSVSTEFIATSSKSSTRGQKSSSTSTSLTATTSMSSATASSLSSAGTLGSSSQDSTHLSKPFHDKSASSVICQKCGKRKALPRPLEPCVSRKTYGEYVPRQPSRAVMCAAAQAACLATRKSAPWVTKHGDKNHFTKGDATKSEELWIGDQNMQTSKARTEPQPERVVPHFSKTTVQQTGTIRAADGNASNQEGAISVVTKPELGAWRIIHSRPATSNILFCPRKARAPGLLVGCIVFPPEQPSLRYHLKKILQKAIYGAIFYADEEKKDAAGQWCHQRYVALKMMSRKLATEHQGETAEDIIAEVNFRDAMLGHPNILTYDFYWEERGVLFLVLPFAEFGDLFDAMLSRQSPLSEEEGRWLFSQLLSAAAHCQKNGIAFRDHSMENVLLFRDPEDPDKLLPAITDPGQAIRVNVNEKNQPLKIETTQLFGKAFRPPEAYLKRPYDPLKVDVFCLGWMLFFVLTKRQAFSRALLSDIDWCLLINKDFVKYKKRTRSTFLSPTVCSLLWKMLDPDPASRYTLQECLSHPWFQGPKTPLAVTSFQTTPPSVSDSVSSSSSSSASSSSSLAFPTSTTKTLPNTQHQPKLQCDHSNVKRQAAPSQPLSQQPPSASRQAVCRAPARTYDSQGLHPIAF